MKTDERNRRTQAYRRFRSYFDYAMGAFYIGMGLFLFFADKWGLTGQAGIKVQRPWVIALGVLLIAYGLFRIYRGIRHIF